MNALALALDPSLILVAQGLPPDPWQRTFLLAEDRVLMLCCSRGAGKSRVTSAKALHRAVFYPNSLVLIINRSQRQAKELLRYCQQGYNAIRLMGLPCKATRETMTEMEFDHGSRIVCLPSREETVRTYQGVALLIKDEAARVPDDLNRAVTPMIAVSKGQEVDLSTPFGRRGWFYKKWEDDGRPDIRRFKITWRDCPRHNAEFIAKEERENGKDWVAQEYECEFGTVTGLVYPEFEQKCGWENYPVPIGNCRKVGGIDFGYRNPFAAVWGHLDEEGFLELTDERYERECALHRHMEHLPKDVEWYADPAHPTEIQELRRAGFCVRAGNNKLEAGIAAVRARVQSRRLRIWRQGCPNLLAEAGLYRYPDLTEVAQGARREIPIDDDNHALAALRYCISRIDAGFIRRWLKDANHEQDRADEEPRADRFEESVEALYGIQPQDDLPEKIRKRLQDESIWTRLN